MPSSVSTVGDCQSGQRARNGVAPPGPTSLLPGQTLDRSLVLCLIIPRMFRILRCLMGSLGYELPDSRLPRPMQSHPLAQRDPGTEDASRSVSEVPFNPGYTSGYWKRTDQPM